MKKWFFFCAILFVYLDSVHAEELTDTLVLGFQAKPVFEFKKAEMEYENKSFRFPPRTDHSLIVTEVTRHSAAANAGLREYDIIRSINRKPIRMPGAAEKALESLKPQDKIELGIIRRGRTKKLKYSTLVIKPITNLVLSSRSDSKKGAIEVRHKDSTASVYARKNFQLYFTKKAGKPSILYLRIAHFDSNNFFTKKFTVLTEKNTYKVEKKITREEYATLLLNDINEINALGLFSKLNQVLKSRTRIIAAKVDAGEKIKPSDVLTLEHIGLGSKIVQNFKDGVEQKRETFIDIDDLNRPHVLVAFGNYRLWEWYDEPLKKSQESMIKDMAISEKVTLRYHGSKHFKDYKLDPEVCRRMVTVLWLFKANGGKLPE